MEPFWKKAKMESVNVQNVYQQIASHFSDTRYKIWRGVQEFLSKLIPNTLVADIGCGNGKNMLFRKDMEYIASDITPNLLGIAVEKSGKDGVLASGVSLPFRNQTFDSVISIAVVHHLSTKGLRKQFINELVRICSVGGEILFTVWMEDQPKKSKWISLETPGDYHIPWTTPDGETLQRFYHFFTELELRESIPFNCEIISLTSECYNYNVVLRRIL